MSKEFNTETFIEADPKTVWSILTDTASWPQWDPYCERIEGEVAAGAKVTAYTKLQPGRGFKLTVAALEAERRMVWSGGMPLGLFKGERTFSLDPEADGVRFSMREVFSGPMLALIGSSIPDMSEAFDVFAAGLKARAENAVRRAA